MQKGDPLSLSELLEGFQDEFDPWFFPTYGSWIYAQPQNFQNSIYIYIFAEMRQNFLSIPGAHCFLNFVNMF